MTDTAVAAYVAALMDDGYAPATIKQAAAAIEAGARAQGQPDPRGPLARQTLAGAVRRNAGEGGARSRVCAARTRLPRPQPREPSPDSATRRCCAR